MKKVLLLILSLSVIILSANFVSVTAYCESSNFSGKAAYVIDFDTGTCIFANNESQRLPIASMTKIMLLDIVFESIEKGDLRLDEKIIVSKKASGMGGSQVFLQANKQYLAEDLIKSVIIASANDASVALAERISGDEESFVALMNDRSKEMMLTNTLFSNCTGLPKETQYSSAKDVAFMLKSLLNHTLYFKYSNIWLDKIVHPDGSETTLTNTNKLIRFYDGCDGGKTGFTNESKYCLAATAKRGDTRLITVVIGENDSKTRFSDVKNFFERGFSNYLTKIVLDKNVSLEEKLYSPFVKGEWVDVYPEENLCAFCQKGETSDFKYKVNLTNPMSKTIKNGDVVGEIILFKNGVECSRTKAIVRGEIDLINYGDALDRVFENWSVAK